MELSEDFKLLRQFIYKKIDDDQFNMNNDFFYVDEYDNSNRLNTILMNDKTDIGIVSLSFNNYAIRSFVNEEYNSPFPYIWIFYLNEKNHKLIDNLLQLVSLKYSIKYIDELSYHENYSGYEILESEFEFLDKIANTFYDYLVYGMDEGVEKYVNDEKDYINKTYGIEISDDDRVGIRVGKLLEYYINTRSVKLDFDQVFEKIIGKFESNDYDYYDAIIQLYNEVEIDREEFNNKVDNILEDYVDYTLDDYISVNYKDIVRKKDEFLKNFNIERKIPLKSNFDMELEIKDVNFIKDEVYFNIEDKKFVLPLERFYTLINNTILFDLRNI